MTADWTRVMKEGFVAGLLGYAAVVLVFLAMNLASGQEAFHTPALLGGALFHGLEGGGGVSMDPGPIIAYNGVHLLVSLLIGIGAAWLLLEAERFHSLWYVVFFAFMAVALYITLLFGVFVVEIRHVLSWRAVVLGSGVGGAATVGYLLWAHRSLAGQLREEATT